jgi:hypothetical protein
VHYHRLDTDGVEQNDILGEAFALLRVEHRVAAVLDNESGAAKALDIGQGFGQHLRSFELILQRFTPLEVPQLIRTDRSTRS